MRASGGEKDVRAMVEDPIHRALRTDKMLARRLRLRPHHRAARRFRQTTLPRREDRYAVERRGPGTRRLRFDRASAEQQTIQGVAVPSLEPGSAPATVHDEEPMSLGASDRIEDVGGSGNIQAHSQTVRADDDPQ